MGSTAQAREEKVGRETDGQRRRAGRGYLDEIIHEKEGSQEIAGRSLSGGAGGARAEGMDDDDGRARGTNGTCKARQARPGQASEQGKAGQG
jgi:hypothetical protein